MGLTKEGRRGECTSGRPMLMVIPPAGYTRPCPVHAGGHYVRGQA